MIEVLSSGTSSGISKFRFTPVEDTRLRELVGVFGHSDWGTIARYLPTRTVRQCRERWFYYLAPSVINGPWSSEEDALLLDKFGEIGSKWKALTQFFPGRTDVNIKNHHAALVRRRSPFIASESPPVAATQQADAHGFFDDVFPELLPLLLSFEMKEGISDSDQINEEMEDGFPFTFLEQHPSFSG
jgi:hypothetical protein